MWSTCQQLLYRDGPHIQGTQKNLSENAIEEAECELGEASVSVLDLEE